MLHKPYGFDTRRRTRFLVIAFLAAVALAAPAQPKVQILTSQLVETLTPAAIDRLEASLFTADPAPKARLSVDSWLITFQSLYPDGTPATILAQLFIPRFADRAVRPLYVFATGSTGLTSNCRPSREHVVGIHWGLYRTHVLAFAAQGAVGMLPDYMGFADTGHLQPFYSAVAEGRMMLDSIRAARTFLGQQAAKGVADTAAFTAGFSQGGHAAFAAADLRSSYAPDVKLRGVIGYGPATDVVTLFREFPVDAPMVIYTYAALYGKARFDPAAILAPKWAETLQDDVTRQCIGGMQAYYPWTPRELFRKEFADALLAGTLPKAYPGINAVLTQNSSGLSGHRVPALILEGTDDVVVSVPSQTAFARALSARGSPVQLSIYKGVRHDTRQAAFGEALKWMTTITQGGKPPSNGGSL
ncbi:MAG TPA: lipase family protein [Spirochaetia bacterium]|nr:lipase family protein [Spirochaetia bacterium]